MNERASLRTNIVILVITTGVGSFTCGLLLGLTIFGRWFWAVPGIEIGISPTSLAVSPPTPPAPATPVSPPASPTPALPPSPVPPIYLTLNVNEYPEFTLYWKRALWETEVSGSMVTEDFEKDEADYGEVSFPYLTGNGFLLTGQTTAQILRDESLLPSGNLIHFRDWGNGLTFSFPNDTAVTAFGFDYKPSETWQLTVNDSVITIPGGEEVLSGSSYMKTIQSGLSFHPPNMRKAVCQWTTSFMFQSTRRELSPWLGGSDIPFIPQ